MPQKNQKRREQSLKTGKHWIKAAAAVLSAALLCGCVPHTELNEKAIIMAIGIDFEEDLYSVTFQYYSPTGMGGKTLVDNSQPNVLTSSGKGENVYGALEDAAFKCGRVLMLGVTQIIIIGEDAAKHSVSKVMEFTKSFFQSHPDMLITVAEGKAEDYLKVKFNEGTVSTEKIKFMLNNAEKNGIVSLPNVLDLFKALQTKQKSSCLPRMRLIDDGKSDASKDGKTIQIAGGVLIKNGMAVKETDIEVMTGLEMLCCRSESATVTVEREEESVSVNLLNVTTNIEPSFEEGKLIFNAKTTADGRYLIVPGQLYNQLNHDEIEEDCGSRLIERMKRAVEETVFAEGADPLILEKIIRHKSYKLWKEIEEDYEELLKNSVFNFTVDIEIDKLILTK